MAYKHGIYGYEVPTSLLPPTQVDASTPVVFGTAPINLSKRDKLPVNEPILCHSYKEAVEAIGYSDDWEKYTLSEFIYSHFSLYAMAPVIFINVLDHEKHKQKVSNQNINVLKRVAVIEKEGILLDTLEITNGETVYSKEGYSVAFDSKGYVVITIKKDGEIPADIPSISVSYNHLDPSLVVSADVVGGIDVSTGRLTGLELVNEVFPRFRILPGQILAPGFSHDPLVAAVMKAKAENINGHFRCITLVDVPTNKVKKYTDVAAWKNDNNYMSERQLVCYPKLSLGGKQFFFSTQLAGAICKTDAANEDVPYVSPSNKSLQADGAVLADGAPVFLGPEQAAYLNGQGIITALNFSGGWKVWGNRTGVYPAVTDSKDAFISVRRMFDWIQNTIILTYWQKIDSAITKRLIESITDSINLWLNGLTARGFLIGGRVEFNASENPATNLMDGIIKFHVYLTPPSPAREIDFIVEYDPKYMNALFAA
nr:phage tail sheath family protein [Brevibacillus laterosporus]